MRDLYVKTPQALEALLAELRRVGYEIKDLRKDEFRADRGVPVSEMEEKGWSLWYASLPDIRHGKCKSCGSVISVAGVRFHGHKCEICGEVTYYDLVDGSTMKFVFLNNRERNFLSPKLKMRVKRWDVEQEDIYFYYEFLEGGLSVVTGNQATAYLNENKRLWQVIEEDGQKLLKVRYSLYWDRDTAAIEAYDSYGHYWNHSIVKIWDGKEYGELDHLPIPESMNIFETWHWSPLQATPYLHERILSAAGQVSDKGYYYQDGRSFFMASEWKEMAKFVRHFTVLNGDRFDDAWPKFRSSGPGGIDDLAHFCHGNPVVENRPNIGNILVVASKLIEGKPLTESEITEAVRGVESEEGVDLIRGFLGKKR